MTTASVVAPVNRNVLFRAFQRVKTNTLLMRMSALTAGPVPKFVQLMHRNPDKL